MPSRTKVEGSGMTVAVSRRSKLTSLLGDEDRRMRLGLAARAHAQAHFRSDAVVAATLEVYEEAIGARKGSVA